MAAATQSAPLHSAGGEMALTKPAATHIVLPPKAEEESASADFRTAEYLAASIRQRRSGGRAVIITAEDLRGADGVVSVAAAAAEAAMPESVVPDSAEATPELLPPTPVAAPAAPAPLAVPSLLGDDRYVDSAAMSNGVSVAGVPEPISPLRPLSQANRTDSLSPLRPPPQASKPEPSKAESRTPGVVGAPPKVAGPVMATIRHSLGHSSRHATPQANRVRHSTPALSKSNSLGNFVASPPTARLAGKPQRGVLISGEGNPGVSTPASVSGFSLSGAETSYSSSRGVSPNRTVYVNSTSRAQTPVTAPFRTSPRDPSVGKSVTGGHLEAVPSRRRPTEVRGIPSPGVPKTASVLADPAAVHLNRSRNGQVRSKSPLAARSTSPLRPASRRILVSSATGGTPRLSGDSWPGQARLPTPEPRGKVPLYTEVASLSPAHRGSQAASRQFAYTAEVVSTPMSVPSRNMEGNP